MPRTKRKGPTPRTSNAELVDQLDQSAKRVARVAYRINVLGDEDEGHKQELQASLVDYEADLAQWKVLVLRRMK